MNKIFFRKTEFLKDRDIENFNISQHSASCRKTAFTLAEVLITLGIIGIVAAMTLPPLIQKHQKQVWVNQLKKAMSTWENGMKLMMADDGVDNLDDT